MSAASDLELINQALLDPDVKSYVYKGRTYTLTELRDDLIPKLQKQKEAEDAAKARSEGKSTFGRITLADAEDAVIRANQPLEDARRKFAAGQMTELELKPFQDAYDAATKTRDRLLGKTTEAGAGPSKTKPTAITTDKDLGVKVVGEQPPADDQTPPPGGGGGAGGEQPAKDARKAFIDAELVKRKLADTPANRAALRKEYAAKQPAATTAPAVLTPEIEDMFKKKYPTYAWMLTDLDREKYADLFELIAEASNPQKEMLTEEFTRRFKGTSFTRELEVKKLNQQLVASVGSFSWGAGQLAKFLNKANQFGYTGESLKQAAYQALFEKDPKTNQYVNQNAINEVQASTPYLRLKNIGDQFLAPLPNDRIIESLTGQISEDDLLRLTRLNAKSVYPHLAQQIDAGLTLKDLAYNYQQAAADVLEMDANQIDMTKGKFSMALKTGEGGKERVMSTSEWKDFLRTDPDFGYQYTKQANQDATDLALSIARAFGKVK